MHIHKGECAQSVISMVQYVVTDAV